MADSEVAIANLALLDIGSTKNLISTFEDPLEEAEVCKLIYYETRDALFAEHRWPRCTRHAYPAQLGGAAWVSATSYALGAFVSYAPAAANVVNMPETVSTFVYVSLQAANQGHAPDSNPTWWALVSRAAWAYVFQLPGDVISVQGLYRYGRNPREDQEVPYDLGNDPNIGTVLFTDTGLPWLEDWTSTTAPHSIELVYTAQITDPKQFPAVFSEALHWAMAPKLALALRKDAELAAKLQVMADRKLGIARAIARNEVQPDPAPMPSHIAARATTRRGSSRW